MDSRWFAKWMVASGTVASAIGIALAEYADSVYGSYLSEERAWHAGLWFIGIGIALLFPGVIIWSIRTTSTRCLVAAIGCAGTGTLIAVFGRINVHGTTILLALLVLTAALLVLALTVATLVHYLKPKIGSKAYLVAFTPIVLVSFAVFAEFKREQPNEGQPKIIVADKIAGMKKSLPSYADFSISGVSFFDGKLYAATNIGIVEVSNGEATQLYQFQSSDSVTSGPWLDRADHLLWASDDHTGELLRYDGNKWARTQEPVKYKNVVPPAGTLEGIQPIGTARGFWLASNMVGWKWDPVTLMWQPLPSPSSSGFDHFSAVIGVLPIEETPFLIVRHEMMTFMLQSNQNFASDEVVFSRDFTPIATDGKPFLADSWIVSDGAGYICTKVRSLIRVTKQGVARIASPGECEALAADDDSNLLVSFKGKGVFRYTQGQWTLVAQSPYPLGTGNYWTHIAASSGQLAIAIDAQSVVDSQRSTDSDMKFTRNAPTGLWVLKDGVFNPVKF